MKKKYIILFVLLFIFFNGINASAEEFSIIVNNVNPITSIKKKTLSKIFLMKRKNWDNGDIILPVNLSKKNKFRNFFSIKILGRSAKKINRYYLKKALSGKGQPPKTFLTEKEIIEFVSWNKGAIGYVSKPDSTVKVISIK